MSAFLAAENPRAVEPVPIIYREEVTAILEVLADLNVHVRRILDLLQEEFDGEEEEGKGGA